MRKFLLAASGMALAISAFALPVAAQDATEEAGIPTIAELVVASAGAETPEFSTLLTAVQAADPAVLEALSDPEAQLTVFAPTDAAFAVLAESLGEEAFGAVLADPAALTNILLYHVVEGVVPSADLVALLDENGGAVSVPTLQGQSLDFNVREDGVIEIDAGVARITAVDITASNGIVHVIDAVLMPESRTIAGLVTDLAGAETPEFSTLLAAVAAADPSVLATLDDLTASLTVFAPTDAAFAALAEALGEEAFNGILADPAALTNILLYHVVAGEYRYADIGAALMGDDMMEMPEGFSVNEDGTLSITMANGDTATIAVTDSGATINGANIVATDVEAANGVVHVIDAVIVPPTE